MRYFALQWQLSNLKKISRKTKVCWVLVTLVLLGLLCSLFQPVYDDVKRVESCELTIEKAYLRTSNRMVVRRTAVVLVSGGTRYVCWYPRWAYGEYAQLVERDLLSGLVTQITVQVPEKQSLLSSITKEIRVTGMQSENSIYYQADSALLLRNRVTLVVVLCLFVLIWIGGTFWGAVVYGVIKMKKRTQT